MSLSFSEMNLLSAAPNFRSGCLLRQKNRLNVWQDTALSDGHTGQQLVQLLVVTDGELQMSRDDSRLLVISRRVAGQLEHFGGQIFHNGCQIDGRASSHSLRVVALAKQTMNSADWELQSGSARTALRLSLHFASLAASRHIDDRSERKWKWEKIRSSPAIY